MKSNETFSEARLAASRIAGMCNARNYNWLPLAELAAISEPEYIAEVMRGIYENYSDLSFGPRHDAPNVPRAAVYMLRELCEAFEAMGRPDARFTTSITVGEPAKPAIPQIDNTPADPRASRVATPL